MGAPPAPQLKDLVHFMASGLCTRPQEIQIDEMEEDGALVYELTVSDEDLGRVIGREGRTARAMRALLSAAAAKMNRRAILEILE